MLRGVHAMFYSSEANELRNRSTLNKQRDTFYLLFVDRSFRR